MLQRWKLILANWINCYFNKVSEDEQNVNVESLLSIISHLRENLNLDESKSSIFEAHTVEEFLCEKYPEFKFENGTVEAANEEEICLSASLLLFFVCVNSKNFDIKNAMCSKLSSEDQETILKFSKCLMECPVISVRDVQAAITEACGQDVAAIEMPQFTVAETPPVLRSLHSEVRRLKAALDAEKFDRTYLQEELSRTNGRLEHLLKEKEQYKLEILNLKAKISLCCGEKADAQNYEATADKSSKLVKQLQQLEARLEETQMRLDDVAYERDVYKEKMDELKNDRDKWFTLSQQENARVSQLTDELDTERRHVQSLKDLVAELQQHNRLNGLDSSSLECDDPDASINALQHNSSICSEVCSNIVEVQLSEERAKIVQLKQQIQSLQDQLHELELIRKTEKKTMENEVAQRENVIFNLKHRINEEIEERNNLKIHCDNEMTKLNNDMNELEQKLKENNENSRSVIDEKMEEIQTLQEEKLSLLQSLDNETTKLENIIKDLKSELDSERQSRSSMKDSYENHIMKLNEKVLNRNNELVELQNSIFEKGEKIDTLQVELKKEKDMVIEYNNKYQILEEEKFTIESDLRYKRDEIQNLNIKIQHNTTVIEDMKIEIQQLKTSVSSLDENCKTLESVKEQLLEEIKNRDTKLEETLKDINHVNEVFTHEKEKLLQDMDERNATVSSLQIQLQNEIKFKVGLQNELAQLNIAKTALLEELKMSSLELSKLRVEMEDKDRTIDAMDLYIQEEKRRNIQAKEKMQNMKDDIIAKENDIKILNGKMEATIKSLQEEIKNNAGISRNEVLAEIANRETLELQVNLLLKDKSHIEKDLSLKCEEILMLRDECDELSRKLDENESLMQILEQKLCDERIKSGEIESKFATEMSIVKTKVNDIQKVVAEMTTIMEIKIKKRESHLLKLGNDLEIIKNIHATTINNYQKTKNENELFISKLNEEASYRTKLEEDYKNQNTQFECLTSQFKEELLAKDREISCLKVEIQSLLKTIGEKAECLNAVVEKIRLESQTKSEHLRQKEIVVKILENEIAELKLTNKNIELHFNDEIENKTQAIHALEKHIELLNLSIEKEKTCHEDIIKEKNEIINKLKQKVEDNVSKLEHLTQYSEELKTTWEGYKADTIEAIKEKEDKIAKLNEIIITFEQKVKEVDQEKEDLKEQIVLIEESFCFLQSQLEFENLIIEEKSLRDILESEKEILLSEKQNLLADKVLLELKLTEERSTRVSLQNDKMGLLSENENLLEGKIMLAQELSEERSSKNIAEEEKVLLQRENIELKRRLDKEIAINSTLLEEKDCLTQQLIEEKSAKEIAEKEKELLVVEKEVLERKLIGNEKDILELHEKINILNRELVVLQQELTLKIENVFNLNEEIKKLNEYLAKQKSFDENVLKKNHSMFVEIDQLKKDLFKANAAQEILKTEKKSLETALYKEKCTHDEIETEKNNMTTNLELEIINKEKENKILLEKYDKLKQTFEDRKKEYLILSKENEELLLNLRSVQELLNSEKESFEKALNTEKSILEEIKSEKNNLAMKSELDLMNWEKEKTILHEEVEKLKSALLQQKEKQSSLTRANDLVIGENKSLMTSLGIEKCIRDKIETEKKDLTFQLDDLKDKLDQYKNACENYAIEITNKDMETKQSENALKQLKEDHQYLLDINLKISTAICDGFDKLVQKYDKENVCKDILQKLNPEKDLKNMPLEDACEFMLSTVDILTSELSLVTEAAATLKNENLTLCETLKQKDIQVSDLEIEIKRLEKTLEENKMELIKQSETYATSMNSKIQDIQTLQQENQTLHNELNDVKIQLEVKVHSLKEKLNDSENLTDKLKENYENQLENLNVMITKLTNYLKEKTIELEALRKDKDLLQQTIGDSCKVIKTLEEEVKTEKHNYEKLTSDFESERQVLKNVISVTESVMADTKQGLNNEIAEHLIAKDCLQVEIKGLKNLLNNLEMKYRAVEMANTSLFSLLKLEREAKWDVEKESEIVREYLDEVISYLSKERNTNTSVISALEFQEKVLAGDYEKMKNDLEIVQNNNCDLKIAMIALENDLRVRDDKLEKVLREKSQIESELQTNMNKLAEVLEGKSQLENILQEKIQELNVVQLEVVELKSEITDLINNKNDIEQKKNESLAKIEECKAKMVLNDLKGREEIEKLKLENQQLLGVIQENKTVITNLEQLIKHELEENHKLRDEHEQEQLVVANKCTFLEQYQTKAKNELEERQNEIHTLRNEIGTLQSKIELCEHDSKAKDGIISKISKEKDTVISTISKELVEEKAIREKYEKELQEQKSVVNELRNKLEIRALKKENEQLIRAIGQQETFALQEKSAEKYAGLPEPRDHYQVDNSSSDNTHSSVESLKTITDLEKIINDKNRTITTLQTDITYLKSLMAESETKLLDVNKELEVTKENCQQLSSQLKKIVYQKNEEIADLKKQVMKMSVTENRASQIIKVSAKYQAIILKRIAEIKSNTVLKELTNFGNSGDNELKRSLNAGTVTMEELENFLDTTDRHLRRCSEKQIALQKERDRLNEVNRINESELINLKKFLTELSVSFQTFSSLKDLYGNKLSRVISVQRTVRREILNLDGRITDATMCKLERGYGAAMQDLAECTMNLERWVERCISRTVSVEKIKQAFTSDCERLSLASPSFQNTGLEIQLEELEKSFQKLLEEVARAVKGEGSRESQASTVMEVRAEYEDKLNRMKSKMKDLFNEQMALLKNKQREEIGLLERELQKTRDRMEDSKRAYENHIKELTKELWSVGEKYLVKNDEAEWLRKKQRSGSLMSLQHVHSSGLVPPQEPALRRQSDAHSLRSLPVNDNIPKGKSEGRGLHMSDEEGEVFDNRWLKELSATPRRDAPPGQRLSELKWRNSLCPPHLKSSYPAETQFAPVLDEEDIKAGSLAAVRPQRKEVGITAYKKPGPPTPSKQAGRLSATDSELRESLRVEGDPHAHTERKTSTPARFRAFLRFNKNDTNEGTPRARRLSNIFRKK